MALSLVGAVVAIVAYLGSTPGVFDENPAAEEFGVTARFAAVMA